MVSIFHDFFLLIYMILSPHDSFKMMAASCHLSRISVFRFRHLLLSFLQQPPKKLVAC